MKVNSIELTLPYTDVSCTEGSEYNIALFLVSFKLVIENVPIRKQNMINRLPTFFLTVAMATDLLPSVEMFY